jgi:hypothetical protein
MPQCAFRSTDRGNGCPGGNGGLTAPRPSGAPLTHTDAKNYMRSNALFMHRCVRLIHNPIRARESNICLADSYSSQKPHEALNLLVTEERY